MPTNTYVALQTTTVTGSPASSVVFSPIPQTYTDLVIVAQPSVTTSASVWTSSLFFNTDTGTSSTNYSNTWLYGDGTSAASFRWTSSTPAHGVPFAGAASGTFDNMGITHIMNYSNSTTNKTALTRFSQNANATYAVVSLWRNTAPITSITLYPGDAGSNTFAVDSTFTLYGIAAASVGAKATGGTIYSDSQYFYHVFTGNGTLAPTQSISADVLVVAGGGGGGSTGGGGGGGGYRTANLSLSVTNYSVTVGGGGAGSPSGGSGARGANGVDSTISTITSTGGGGGGGDAAPAVGRDGGSGGGAPRSAQGAAGAGNTPSTSPSQGNNGGASSSANYQGGAGGGGGAGAVGGNGNDSATGAGGIGSFTAISGGAATNFGQLSSGNYYFAGGGSGGAVNANGGAGAAGIGGGGLGSILSTIPGGNGTANTGGGGGGGGFTSGVGTYSAGGTGGSGVVIVRYAK